MRLFKLKSQRAKFSPKGQKRKTELKKPLYGLVLAGGHSTRMGMDKATLRYHGKQQLEHCFTLLSLFCQEVFISIKRKQALLEGYKNFPQIHDTYFQTGPLGGILSAMEKHPTVAWLVLACDMPYVDGQTIETLIQERNPRKMATVCMNVQNRLAEPLCAIYEPHCRPRLLEYLDLEYKSPQAILCQLDIQQVWPKNETALVNINYPDEYYNALNFFEKTVTKISYESSV